MKKADVEMYQNNRININSEKDIYGIYYSKDESVLSKGFEPVEFEQGINFCMYSDYVPLTLDEWIACERRRME